MQYSSQIVTTNNQLITGCSPSCCPTNSVDIASVSDLAFDVDIMRLINTGICVIIIIIII